MRETESTYLTRIERSNNRVRRSSVSPPHPPGAGRDEKGPRKVSIDGAHRCRDLVVSAVREGHLPPLLNPRRKARSRGSTGCARRGRRRVWVAVVVTSVRSSAWNAGGARMGDDDVNREEVLHHVVKRHPESAVIGVERDAHLSDELGRPFVRMVRPVTRPLKVAPLAKSSCRDDASQNKSIQGMHKSGPTEQLLQKRLETCVACVWRVELKALFYHCRRAKQSIIMTMFDDLDFMSRDSVTVTGLRSCTRRSRCDVSRAAMSVYACPATSPEPVSLPGLRPVSVKTSSPER